MRRVLGTEYVVESDYPPVTREKPAAQGDKATCPLLTQVLKSSKNEEH